MRSRVTRLLAESGLTARGWECAARRERSAQNWRVCAQFAVRRFLLAARNIRRSDHSGSEEQSRSVAVVSLGSWFHGLSGVGARQAGNAQDRGWPGCDHRLMNATAAADVVHAARARDSLYGLAQYRCRSPAGHMACSPTAGMRGAVEYVAKRSPRGGLAGGASHFGRSRRRSDRCGVLPGFDHPAARPAAGGLAEHLRELALG